MRAFGLVLLLGCSLACGCDRAPRGHAGGASSSRGPSAREPSPAEPKPDAARATLAAREAVRAAAVCAERIARVRGLPDLGVLPVAPAERAALLAQVKSTPVVFLSEPGATTSDPVALMWRKELAASELPGKMLARLYKRFRPFPAFLRDVLLSDGYVYARSPVLAATLADGLSLATLFREERLVIERGSTRLAAVRGEDGAYSYADGPEMGKPARVFVFDRVWIEGSEPGEPRHLDVATVATALASERFELERVTTEGIVARLVYEKREVPALFRRTGAALELVCEGTPGADAEILATRRTAQRRQRAVEALRRAILEQVDEALPFDEPKTEVGQQDGKLRQEWRLAYRQGSLTYHFNDDRYRVFDASGRPFVPQVCIDFIIDTFERAGGSWWNPRGAAPGKTSGRVDFDALGMENRRSVEQFLDLAGKTSDWFEFRAVPQDEQVPLERRDRFFTTLFEHRSEYRPGDVVVIFGLRSDEKYHYHSFFVFDADPVTGMPTLVAGNSGRPRIRALGVEMAPAPKRKLFARIRPRLEWLEHAVTPDRVAARDEAEQGAQPGGGDSG